MAGKKQGRTTWPDEVKEKALQMMLEGISYRRISESLGVPPATLARWKSEMGGDRFAEMRADRRRRVVEKIWDTAEAALDRMKALIRDEKALQPVVGAFIYLADKGNLLSGEPTNISEERTRSGPSLGELLADGKLWGPGRAVGRTASKVVNLRADRPS